MTLTRNYMRIILALRKRQLLWSCYEVVYINTHLIDIGDKMVFMSPTPLQFFSFVSLSVIDLAQDMA